MNDRSDQQLLKDYANEQSENAFAEIVRRHIDLVYSAALRMVCDDHLAKDVAQGVFVALAQKALSLGGHPVLAGWLHRTTQNLASKVVRSEVRRRVREQEAATMNDLCAKDPEGDWELIAPHLDAALGELNETDRGAVLLRYFEGKSAREIAANLGISEEAAHKRTTRSVQRMREYFAKRGVRVGVSGLLVVISTHAVHSAPAGLASALSGGALAGATTSISLYNIMSSSILKSVILGAAVVTASVSIIVERQKTASLRTQVEEIHARLKKSEMEKGELAEQMTTLARQHKSDANQTELLQLRNEVGKLRERAKAFEKSAETARMPERPVASPSQNPFASGSGISDAQKKFNSQYLGIMTQVRQIGAELKTLKGENKLQTAFLPQGGLNETLRPKIAADFDLGNVEFLIVDTEQIQTLMESGSRVIIARTKAPLTTPNGDFLRIYLLANGEVTGQTEKTPKEARSGSW